MSDPYVAEQLHNIRRIAQRGKEVAERVLTTNVDFFIHILDEVNNTISYLEPSTLTVKYQKEDVLDAVCVIAGSYREAQDWAQNHNLNSSQWFYLYSPTDIRVARGAYYVKIGTYTSRKDWRAVEQMLKERRATDMYEVISIMQEFKESR